MEIHFNSGNKRGKTNMLQITPLGKQKLENLDGDGPKFAVLSALGERGPCTLSEIAAESGYSKQNCKYVLKADLIPQGLAQVVKAGEQKD